MAITTSPFGFLASSGSYFFCITVFYWTLIYFFLRIFLYKRGYFRHTNYLLPIIYYNNIPRFNLLMISNQIIIRIRFRWIIIITIITTINLFFFTYCFKSPSSFIFHAHFQVKNFTFSPNYNKLTYIKKLIPHSQYRFHHIILRFSVEIDTFAHSQNRNYINKLTG